MSVPDYVEVPRGVDFATSDSTRDSKPRSLARFGAGSLATSEFTALVAERMQGQLSKV